MAAGAPSAVTGSRCLDTVGSAPEVAGNDAAGGTVARCYREARMRLSALQGLLLTAGLLLLAAPTAGAAIAYVPCTRPAGFECGTLAVPLDRTGAVPGAIELAAVRRAAAANPTRTALVALAGGPGQAALPLALDFAAVLAPALATRDLLVFDQRGTGASTPLACRAQRPDAHGIGEPLRGRARPPARAVHDLRERRRHRGAARGERLRQARALRRLLRHEGRAGLRGALPRPASSRSSSTPSCCPRGPTRCSARRSLAMRRVLKDLCAGGACAGHREQRRRPAQRAGPPAAAQVPARPAHRRPRPARARRRCPARTSSTSCSPAT